MSTQSPWRNVGQALSPREVAEEFFNVTFARVFKAGDDPQEVAERVVLEGIMKGYIATAAEAGGQCGQPGPEAYRISAMFGPQQADEYGPVRSFDHA